jgi:hypothetical protein
MMTTVMRRRGTAIAGAAAFALSAVVLSAPAGADSDPGPPQTGGDPADMSDSVGPAPSFPVHLEDCLYALLPPAGAIYVPANSTGWTNGTSGDDVIIGTDGPELINGEGGNDTICAGRGDDWIVGSTGDDMIKGEGGADTIYGNADDDFIIGDAGDDDIYGGDNDDYIEGQRGDDELYGEDGIDALVDYGEVSDYDEFDCGDDTDAAFFDEDIDQVWNCETRVEYSGPTDDGE